MRAGLAELAAPRERPDVTEEQAWAWTGATGGQLAAAIAHEPFPPPEPTDFGLAICDGRLEGDHLAKARFWIAVAEQASEAYRRVGRRALAMALDAGPEDAAVYARLGATALRLADTEPFMDGYADSRRDYLDATGDRRTATETAEEVMAMVRAAMAEIAANVATFHDDRESA